MFTFQVGQTVWCKDRDGFAVRDKIKECVNDGIQKWYILEVTDIYSVERVTFSTSAELVKHFLSRVETKTK